MKLYFKQCQALPKEKSNQPTKQRKQREKDQQKKIYMCTKKNLFQHNLLTLLLLISGFFFTACGKVDLDLANLYSNNDFQKSRIVSSTKAIGNGIDVLHFVVQLASSDGTYKVGFQPTFTVTSGSSVTNLSCTKTDENGYSTCSLTSTSVGVKTVEISNVSEKVISGQVEFILASFSTTATLSASAIATGTGGYKIYHTLGDMPSQIKTTSSGYKVYSGVTGLIVSQLE